LSDNSNTTGFNGCWHIAVKQERQSFMKPFTIYADEPSSDSAARFVLHTCYHYDFGVIFTLFNSHYGITIVIAILRFLLYTAEYTQSTIMNALTNSAGHQCTEYTRCLLWETLLGLHLSLSCTWLRSQ